MSNEDRATRYHRLRRRADIAGLAAAGVALLALVLSGAHVALRDAAFVMVGSLPPAAADVAAAGVLAALLFILLNIVEIPFAFYQGFIVEHRYGLSNQRLPHWLADHGKGAALSVVLGTVGAVVVYLAIGWSETWWWLLAAVLFALAMIALARLAPVLLLPLFYAFKPLDRPALVARLLALADRAGTRIAGVFEWTLSGHTKKANAALTGLGRTRRILLSDTLLADYSDDEVEVVLAHELAHHVHHDIWRGMALQAGLLMTGFLAAHVALRVMAGPLGMRGAGDPAGLPLLLLVGGVWSFLALPVANAASRAHERRADRYALEATGNPRAFVSAMKRLSQQNLAEERPSALVQWLFYSHPPIRERIQAAQRWDGATRPTAAEAQPR